VPKAVDLKPTSLEDQIGFQLRLAQLAVFADLIDALKLLDVRPADMSALLLISENPGMRQHVIGDRLKMARPNVVALVDTLETKKFVERRVDDTDRRAYHLHLTKAGANMVKQTLQVQNEHRTRLLTALDGVDVENLMLGLRRMAMLGEPSA